MTKGPPDVVVFLLLSPKKSDSKTIKPVYTKKSLAKSQSIFKPKSVSQSPLLPQTTTSIAAKES
jgi:hypothetical protein